MRALVPMGLAVLFLFSHSAASLEPRDARGLAIGLTVIDEPMFVDGVAVRVQHAHGHDIPVLARRVLARWKKEGSPGRPLQRAGWEVHARWTSGRSEVIQWRPNDAGGELLHSTLDVKQKPRRIDPPPFLLPAMCRWGRSIDGSVGNAQYGQRTGVCTARPEAAFAAMRESLVAQGWNVSQQGPLQLTLRRGSLHGQLTTGAGTSLRNSAVIWVSEARQ